MIPTAVFLFNLVQDVNILRPLVVMASRDFGFSDVVVGVRQICGAGSVSHLVERTGGTSRRQAGARTVLFHNAWEAARELTGHGILFAASEFASSQPCRDPRHHAGRAAVRTSGSRSSMGSNASAFTIARTMLARTGRPLLLAPIWSVRGASTSLPRFARRNGPKLVVTGPTSALQVPAERLAVRQQHTGHRVRKSPFGAVSGHGRAGGRVRRDLRRLLFAHGAGAGRG